MLGLRWRGGIAAEEGYRLPSLYSLVSRHFSGLSVEDQEAEGRRKPDHPFFPSLSSDHPFSTITFAVVSTIQVLVVSASIGTAGHSHFFCSLLSWGVLSSVPNLLFFVLFAYCESCMTNCLHPQTQQYFLSMVKILSGISIRTEGRYNPIPGSGKSLATEDGRNSPCSLFR